MTRLLGANWRTTLTAAGAALFSALTGLAALPYDLGPIATVIPAEWKTRVMLASAIATLLLKFWNGAVQKDARVTGGTVPNDAPPAPKPPEPPRAANGWTLLLIGLLCLGAALGLSACASSPFTPASAPTAGKIPVHVVAGTHVSGSVANPDDAQYTGGVDVIFGRTEPWYLRLWHCIYGPLTPEDQARWDADLRNEAAATVPQVGVVHYPGEAP